MFRKCEITLDICCVEELVALLVIKISCLLRNMFWNKFYMHGTKHGDSD